MVMLTLHTPSNAPLTAQQQQVADLLLNGSTVTAAAAQSGVHRSTIYHWCRNHKVFVSALDAARRRRVLDLNERIHGLADQAFNVMLDALAGKDVKPLQLRAALALLKMIRDDGASRASASDMADCWLDAQAPVPTPEPPPPPPPPPVPSAPSAEPAHAAHPRNLPCPCGSGLKYKRCCGAPKSTMAAA
jgi:transposase-like protein